MGVLNQIWGAKPPVITHAGGNGGGSGLLGPGQVANVPWPNPMVHLAEPSDAVTVVNVTVKVSRCENGYVLHVSDRPAGTGNFKMYAAHTLEELKDHLFTDLLVRRLEK